MLIDHEQKFIYIYIYIKIISNQISLGCPKRGHPSLNWINFGCAHGWLPSHPGPKTWIHLTWQHIKNQRPGYCWSIFRSNYWRSITITIRYELLTWYRTISCFFAWIFLVIYLYIYIYRCPSFRVANATGKLVDCSPRNQDERQSMNVIHGPTALCQLNRCDGIDTWLPGHQVRNWTLILTYRNCSCRYKVCTKRKRERERYRKKV